MSQKSRKSRSKHSTYRSGFEEDVGKVLQSSGFTYEPGQWEYSVPRKYTPDFVYEGKRTTILVECKGFFRSGDTQKYKAIRDSLSLFEELAFVLMKPNQKINKTTKLTMSQWCDKERIQWYTLDTLEELIKYANTSGD